MLFLKSGGSKNKREKVRKEKREDIRKEERRFGGELHKSKSFNDFFHLHHRN